MHHPILRVAAWGVFAALAGCAAVRPAGVVQAPWEQRVTQLQQAHGWRLDGRAAAALGQQGWQASLDWRQAGAASEVHLAGPFGAGAVLLRLGPDGLSLNGAPPSEAVAEQLQDRLGFDLPLANLRYWLLGVPDPSLPFELTRNDQDRAQTLDQAGWNISYDRYMADRGDLLPQRLVLRRADARVRVAIDHWEDFK
jgi:outer membrane lipoprotein LolB